MFWAWRQMRGFFYPCTDHRKIRPLPVGRGRYWAPVRHRGRSRWTQIWSIQKFTSKFEHWPHAKIGAHCASRDNRLGSSQRPESRLSWKVCILNLRVDKIRMRAASTRREKCKYGICMLAVIWTAAICPSGIFPSRDPCVDLWCSSSSYSEPSTPVIFSFRKHN